MWNEFNDLTVADLAGTNWVQPKIEPSRDDERALEVGHSFDTATQRMMLDCLHYSRLVRDGFPA